MRGIMYPAGNNFDPSNTFKNYHIDNDANIGMGNNNSFGSVIIGDGISNNSHNKPGVVKNSNNNQSSTPKTSDAAKEVLSEENYQKSQETRNNNTTYSFTVKENATVKNVKIDTGPPKPNESRNYSFVIGSNADVNEFNMGHGNVINKNNTNSNFEPAPSYSYTPTFVPKQSGTARTSETANSNAITDKTFDGGIHSHIGSHYMNCNFKGGLHTFTYPNILLENCTFDGGIYTSTNTNGRLKNNRGNGSFNGFKNI